MATQKSSSSVTLREIAEQCGFSYQTVSRILNNQGYLHRPETVAKVRRVATQMGYRPNLLARGVQTGRTRTIGLMLSFGTGSFSTNLLTGVHDELIARDFLPIMLMSRPGLVNELEQIHRLVDRRVDGIILRPAYLEVSDEYLGEIARRNIPLATVDIEAPQVSHADFVGTDDYLGGQLAARHLLELGHRDFIYLSWLSHLKIKQDRRRGFLDAISAHPGVKFDELDVPFDPVNMAYEAILHHFQRKRPPRAMFVSTDDLYLGFIRAANVLGIRIPEDISVVGFGDYDYARRLIPPLTTLSQEPYEIGRQAARLVLQRVEGKKPAPEVQVMRFKPELIIRGTTAPVKK